MSKNSEKKRLKLDVRSNSYLCDELSKLILTGALALVGRVTKGTSLHKSVSPVVLIIYFLMSLVKSLQVSSTCLLYITGLCL
jgi:hypothetical protein